MDDIINIIRFSSTTLPDYVIYTLLLQLYVLATQTLLILYSCIENKQNNSKMIWLILFAAGIYEEVIFRYNLVNLMNEFNLPYVAYITSFLFGFMHLYNIQFLGKKTIINIIIVSNQFIFTTMFGYILYNIHNLKICMLIHIWFNITNFICFKSITYLLPNTSKQPVNDKEMYKYIKQKASTTDNIPNYNKFKESVSKEVKVHKSMQYMWNYDLYIY